MNDCVFCKIVAGEIPSQKVWEDDDVFAFRDLNPQAPQHILIVPKKHIEKLADVTPEDQTLLGKLMLTAMRIAKETAAENGFRVVVNNGESAGQSVWHLHLHLLSGRPFRWPPG